MTAPAPAPSPALHRDATILGFVAARALAILGDQTVTFFVPIAVYGATQKVTSSGIAFLVQWLPRILSMPVSGAYVDRFRARRQLVVVDLARVAMLGLAAVTGSLPLLVVAGGAATLLNGHSTIAVESILGRQVAQDRYPQTQARFQAAQQLVTVAGPALGGMLLGVLPVDAGLAVIAAIFLVAGVWTGLCFHALDRVVVETGGEKLLRRLGTGFSTVFGSRPILSLIAVTLGVNLTASLVLASLPAIIIGDLGQSEPTVGLLAATATVVSFLAALLTAPIAKRREVDVFLWPVALLLVTGALCMILADDVVVMGIGYGCWSAGVTVFTIWMRTWRIRVIPAEQLGAALGVFSSMILASAPLAGVILATAGGSWDPRTILAVVAAVSLVVAPVSLVVFRRQVRSLIAPLNSEEKRIGSGHGYGVRS